MLLSANDDDDDDGANKVLCFSESYSSAPPSSFLNPLPRPLFVLMNPRPDIAPLVLTDDGAVVAVPSMIRLASMGGGSQYVDVGGTVCAAKKVPMAAAALDAAVEGISDAERTFVDRERSDLDDVDNRPLDCCCCC